MDSNLYYIWLANAMGYGSKKALDLLRQSEGPWDIYRCQEKELLARFHLPFTPGELAKLCNKDLSRPIEILRFCKEKHVDVINIDDMEYPRKLFSIQNPPLVLYSYGYLPPVDEQLCLTIVGSRSATMYGMTVAEKLSATLAKSGVVIVSGLARGVDTMAHKGALAGGGKTIGVLGCGIDIAYPPENRELMKRMVRQGAVITEFAPGEPPSPWHFPLRNRIVSALSEGVVVIEAHKRSGSLITAQMALEQGRDVFAVPGSIQSASNSGCNNLIKEGAKLVTGPMDILEEYLDRVTVEHQIEKDYEKELREGMAARQREEAFPQPKKQPTAPKKEKLLLPPQLEGLEKEIFLLLQQQDRSEEQLSQLLDCPITELSAALTMMELEGYIQQRAGKQFSLAELQI